MNPKYLYLTLDLSSLLVPFLFSFYKRAPFYKKWKYLWISILIPALIFILWDEWFTQIGVWGFNPRYLTGIYIGSLPIEEILFFICIPYACVFTYYALNHLVKKDYLGAYQTQITKILILLSLAVAGINYTQWYTASTFFALAIFLIIVLIQLKPKYLGRFFFAFIVILIPFFLINGILTGSFIEEEVVWYNRAEQLDIRLGTIPLEDIFYGMLLLVMNVSIMEYLEKRYG